MRTISSVCLDSAAAASIVVAAALAYTVFNFGISGAPTSKPSDSHRITIVNHSVFNRTHLKSGSIAVLEFIDYQCPFCRAFGKTTMSSIRRDWVDTGRVFYRVYQFPLQSHALAQYPAKVAACASLQDKALVIHDALLTPPQQLDKGTVDSKIRAAQLDVGALSSCLDGAAEALVAADKAVGHTLGVVATPTFLAGAVGRNVDTIHVSAMMEGVPTTKDVGQMIAIVKRVEESRPQTSE